MENLKNKEWFNTKVENFTIQTSMDAYKDGFYTRISNGQVVCLKVDKLLKTKRYK